MSTSKSLILNENIKSLVKKQGFSAETVDLFLKAAMDGVSRGVNRSLSDFRKSPRDYKFRNCKSSRLSGLSKSDFELEYLKEPKLRNAIKHLKSYGVDYYLLEGKALFCFKKMDQKGRISGSNTKRFKEIMKDGFVKYTENMYKELTKMGILKPLPIIYIGYQLDKLGTTLLDVKCVYFENDKIDYCFSLLDMYRTNLFNTNTKQEDLVEIQPSIKVKKKTSGRKSS